MTIAKKLLFIIVFPLLIVVSPFRAQAQERIINFASRVEVQKSGNLVVEETITVNAEGAEIKRGIYRDFPTKYGSFFNQATKGFRVISVTKDGINEPYHTESLSNGRRVYFGDSKVFLQPGVYTYVFKYETTDQLGFFDDHDEIYWNVTGNGWSFPIDTATVSVSLPAEIPLAEIAAISFQGPAGSKEPANPMTITSQSVSGIASRVLMPGEGYTIAVKFPKGYITPPPQYKKYIPEWVFNPKSLAGVAMFAVVGIFYFVLWRKVGRDDVINAAIPVQFEPPKGLTPAEVRFMNNMGNFDDGCISTAILNMAIQGYITIRKTGGDYTLIKTLKDPKDLINEEAEIYGLIFGGVTVEELKKNLEIQGMEKLDAQNDSELEKDIQGVVSMFFKKPDRAGEFTINTSNYQIMLLVQKTAKDYFDKIKKGLIISNRKYLLLSLIPLGLFFIFNLTYNLFYDQISLFLIIFSSIWNAVISMFVASTFTTWKSSLQTKNLLKIGGALFLTLYMVPFVVVGVVTGTMAFSLVGYAGFLGTIIIIYVFYKALPKRTRSARLTQDLIEGFKMFLVSQTEYIQGVKMDLPQKFSMYERYLPFAVALDVEPEWSGKFKETFKQMQEAGLSTNTNWYLGGSGAYSFSNFSVSSFSSSLTGSISSAAVNPSSSSGFGGSGGGGGSSGGGGGGGGGGGW